MKDGDCPAVSCRRVVLSGGQKARLHSVSGAKLADAAAFRIGHFGEAGMPEAGAAIADTLNAMSVRRMSAGAVA
ncbi:2-aminoethylphosphonate--pyruvate aminotransferase [Burkholderia cenocepacia]|uniref:2-aminoethylphosphonate--pyruvate aminotransferase n=1 Tax=Burkholderia cenocepacia TaxID=95486 RepID=UPI0039EFABC3